MLADSVSCVCQRADSQQTLSHDADALGRIYAGDYLFIQQAMHCFESMMSVATHL